MITISAYQHIFTVVEWQDSPKKRRGMQPLFYDQDKITDADLQILEDRSIYYGTTGDPIKWQYYTLPSGKFVVSRGTFLEEPDRLGRSGRFFTHNLIFEASDWNKIQCNPFLIIDCKNLFIASVEEAINQGNKDGSIDPKSIALDSSSLAAPVIPPSFEMDNLLYMQWAGRHIQELLTPPNKTISLAGSPEEVLTKLRLLFYVLPSKARIANSFSTFIDSPDIKFNSVWSGLSSYFHIGNKGCVDMSRLNYLNIGIPADSENIFNKWWSDSKNSIPFEEFGVLLHQTESLLFILEGKSREVKWHNMDRQLLNNWRILVQNGYSKRSAIVTSLIPGFLEKELEQMFNKNPGLYWNILNQDAQAEIEIAKAFVEDLPNNKKSPFSAESLDWFENLARRKQNDALLMAVMAYRYDLIGNTGTVSRLTALLNIIKKIIPISKRVDIASVFIFKSPNMLDGIKRSFSTRIIKNRKYRIRTRTK